MTKILVIEDEELVRENIVERLEAEDFDTISAENGLDGIQLALEQKPNLIICDVMMPELDGYGVLTVLRGDPVTATIPFIFLTAKADKVDIRQGMELGADDYLTKPFTKAELLGTIAARLKQQATVTQQSDNKLEELRRSITNALPQELLNPLTHIVGCSRMLADEYDSVKPHEILEAAQNIYNSAVRLQRLSENFIMYAQIELFATNPEQVKALSNCSTINTKDIILNITQQKAQQFQRPSDLVLEIANSTVRISKEDLKKIVEELVDNAFKFSQPGTPVHVKAVIDKDSFNLSISNYGHNMTPEQIASIGACMQFNHKLYEQQGVGLGLIIAKRITEVHGGKLTIQSLNSQTTVSVALRGGGDTPYPLWVF